MPRKQIFKSYQVIMGIKEPIIVLRLRKGLKILKIFKTAIFGKFGKNDNKLNQNFHYFFEIILLKKRRNNDSKIY